MERLAFEGVSVEGEFLLRDVSMAAVPSFAFRLDHVGQFSIFGSRLRRVATWGFKLDSCDAFSALAESSFYTVASKGFNLRCRQFMLAYNVFGKLHDSSFDVRFGLADIQGNTFRSLSGKPFQSLTPIPREVKYTKSTYIVHCKFMWSFRRSRFGKQ